MRFRRFYYEAVLLILEHRIERASRAFSNPFLLPDLADGEIPNVCRKFLKWNAFLVSDLISTVRRGTAASISRLFEIWCLCLNFFRKS